jgi:hypothetical protein
MLLGQNPSSISFLRNHLISAENGNTLSILISLSLKQTNIQFPSRYEWRKNVLETEKH